MAAGELVVLENVRFNKGEKKDDEELSKKYARAVRRVRDGRFRYCAPRAGLPPTASANLLTWRAQARCWPLNWTRWVKRWKEPARPMVAIVGGSKVSTKLTVPGFPV